MVDISLASHVPMPWGNVDTDVFAAWGQWAGGIGSIAAVIVALGVVLVDSRRRAHEQRDQQAGQARTVTASVRYIQQTVQLMSRNFDNSAWGVVVHNYGSRPILEVEMEAVEVNVDGTTYRDWVIDGDQSAPMLLAPVLGPSEDAKLLGLGFKSFPENQRMSADLPYKVTFTFLDAEGFRWRRTGTDAPQGILLNDREYLS